MCIQTGSVHPASLVWTALSCAQAVRSTVPLFLGLKAAYDQGIGEIGGSWSDAWGFQTLYTSASFAMKIDCRIFDGLTDHLAEHCPTAGCSIILIQAVSHFLYANDITHSCRPALQAFMISWVQHCNSAWLLGCVNSPAMYTMWCLQCNSNLTWTCRKCTL